MLECQNCGDEVFELTYCDDCAEEMCFECFDDEGHDEHEE